MNENVPTHLDLFSGIGGFALAARWAGFRTVGFCELEPYAQAGLRRNFGALADSECLQPAQSEGSKRNQRGWISDSRPRIFGDIFDFSGVPYKGISLLTGGFPCQPFSVAGKQRGAEDDRHLWPQMLRVIDEAKPAWVLGENVPGIIPMELDNVLSDLEAIGYACRPFVIPACAVDAKHRRDRLWIVGTNISNSDKSGLQGSVFGCESTAETAMAVARCSEEVADAKKSRLDGQESARRTRPDGCRSQYARSNGPARWESEPSVGRVAHGVPNRVDRLRGLGNAIVPQVAFEILKAIRGMI